MFVEKEKVYITIATLVVPYLKKDVGEFISLLQTGSLEAGRGKRAGLGIKFGNDHAKTRSIGTSFWKDRSLFDFQKTSDGKLFNWKNSDFVTLAVKDGNSFYDFAFSLPKIELIRSGTTVRKVIEYSYSMCPLRRATNLFKN